MRRRRDETKEERSGRYDQSFLLSESMLASVCPWVSSRAPLYKAGRYLFELREDVHLLSVNLSITHSINDYHHICRRTFDGFNGLSMKVCTGDVIDVLCSLVYVSERQMDG